MGTIQEIISILSRFFNVPRWVWIIIGLLIVAGLLYTVYKRFAPKRKPKPPPTEVAPKEAAEQQSPQHKALRKELKQFFRYLLKQLRLHAPGRNYRYQIPWLLLIGEAESGKSTLLAHNQLNRPLGDPKAPQGGCQVWFFDKGLVLDVSGDYILHQDNIASDQLGWRTFLKLLHHYRPRRPIDEVILTIPCQDLLSQQHNPETLQQKAEHLYQKLWEAQNVSGIRFPVYIVITQSDQMTGFSSFCQALPERFQHHIFGWSNPYTLDTGYKSSLAEEAFTKIYRDLNELQIELVVAFSDIADTDAFLLFPHQFRQIFKNLKIYLDQLFKPSVYHEAFFFRGVYFCGDMAENNLISRRQTVATSDEIDFNILLDEHSQSRHLVFLHHLFRDKLFAEANLARPVFRSLRHRSQMLWAVQGALAAFIIGMILGQWWAYQRIAAEKKSVLKLLTDIEKDLNQLQAERENLNWEYTRQTRQTNAQDFLYGLANIRSDGFSSVFLPPSWLSNVDEQVIQALAKGYNIFISEWMHDGLQRKAEAAIHPNVMPGATDSHDFTQLPTFKALKKFITDLNRLNNNVKRYNAIKESHDINEMNQLVSYLFGVDLPTQFQSQSIFYRATLATVEYEPFELKPLDHIQVARNEAEDLVYQWFERIFRENALYTEVEKLRQILEELDDISREELATSLINLRNSMRRIDQFLTQPEWRWVAKEQLNETLAVEKLFNSIKETSLLGTELSDNLLKLGEARFQEFRQTLLSLQSELTGPILEYHRVQTEDTPKTEPKPQNKADTADNPLTQATQKSSKTYAILKLSPQVIALKETLETFTGQAFMKPTTQRGLKTSVPFNMRLVWRTEELKKAIDLKDIFDNYMEKQLPEVNEQLQPVFRQAGQVSLYENMLDWIRAGQHFEPQTIEMQYAEEVLRTQIQKFGKAAPLLEQILAIFEGVEGTNESSRIIRQLGMEQAYRLLERVDNLLVQEQLYMPIEEAFALWQGQQRLSWLVFAVNDQEEMKYYLELQRRRVHYLAENYAKPLLDFLQGKQQFISEQQTNLLPKWQRILKELEKYSTQKTTNSVTRLEKFILFELDKVKINQCVDSMAGALRPTGDYFLEKKRQLQSSLFQRCQKVADAHAFARYDAIEAEFNQTLAGLFPFATLPEDTLFDEASPAHIQTFFHLYDAYGGQELIDLLKKSQEFGNSRHLALQFLTQIEQVRTFLTPLLNQSLLALKQAPLYDFTLEFRVRRAHEVHANQIIDWHITLADEALNPNGLRVHDQWLLDQPLTIALRWARNSPFRPYWDGIISKTVMTLARYGDVAEEDTAIFHYQSRWALLELLRRQSDLPLSEDPQPHTLKFAIPVKQLVAQRKITEESPTEPKPQTEAAENHNETTTVQIGTGIFSTDPSVNARQELERKFVPKQASERILNYQQHYQQLFEEESQAVLFIRLILKTPEQKQRLVMPEFPKAAPALDYPPQAAQKARQLLPPLPDLTPPKPPIEPEAPPEPPAEPEASEDTPQQ